MTEMKFVDSNNHRLGMASYASSDNWVWFIGLYCRTRIHSNAEHQLIFQLNNGIDDAVIYL